MDESVHNLILDLSLASTLPVGVSGRDFIRATAAASGLVFHTKQMQPRELRELEYSIGPLLTMLTTDFHDPVAAKAASGIRHLLPSRICMAQLLAQNGLVYIAKVLDELLGSDMVDLTVPSIEREICEHLSICYREIGMFYPWEIVKVGALRHSILLLRFGDEILKTAASGTLAVLSTDLNICKQMFTNGAIKPLLNVSDGNNAACMLAGLGCLVQMCNIPEIGIKIVSQGAIPVLERALHRDYGMSVLAIREKALYAFAWLSRIPEVQDKIGTLTTLRGMKRELVSGTMPSRYTVVQLLLNIHGKYELEQKFLEKVVDPLLLLLRVGPWHARNLCIKAVCVLYTSNNDMKMYLVENNIIEYTCALINSKPADLQEAPLVMFLSLCTNKDIPRMLIERGGLTAVCSILVDCRDDIIRELAVVVLKSLSLYGVDIVEAAMPSDRLHLLQRDVDIPTVYGSEYGGLIEEYLQRIIENRRDMHYLLECMTSEELEALPISNDLLQSYQNTFMELDLNCLGILGIDELKMLVVMMGEELDKYELQDLLNEYGTHKKGALNFSEFIKMMAEWNTRFGTGLEKVANMATKRGAVGRARRALKLWLNRDAIEKEQVAEMKERKRAEAEKLEKYKLQFQQHEKLKQDRQNVSRQRQRR